jgi:hypothetical protein
MAVVAPRFTYERLREVAASFLKEHHPSGEIPIPIERIIEFRLHLDIVPVPGLKDEFDVDAFVTSDRTEIRVDRFIQEKRVTRYRFSLAHEVAHLLIHENVFAELKFSTIKEWKAALASIPEDQYDWLEWQAYSLGGLILVPPRPLADLFQTKLEEARRVDIELESADEKLRKIVEDHMGRYLEVSRDVIAKRMQKDGHWK